MSETTAATPPQPRNRLQRIQARARRAVPFVSGVLAAFVALVVYNLLAPPAPPLTMQQVQQSIDNTIASVTPAPPYSEQVYQVIRPSLVLIQTETAHSDAENDYGIGSGVIVTDQGDVLTSLHVVGDATTITLTFADGTESAAVVTATQPEKDIAVLHPMQLPGVLVPATIGNPSAMSVGDEAYVVGNPLGLYGSMSAGVISGFDRSFQPVNSEQRLEGLIQIDAAVNPGNSGGPLLNRAGQVVGIVTGLVNPTEQNVFIGIGFAVPIDVAGGAAGLPPF